MVSATQIDLGLLSRFFLFQASSPLCLLRLLRRACAEPAERRRRCEQPALTFFALLKRSNSP